MDRATPADDPLAEIRAAGSEFRLRLGTLLRQTMSSEVAAPKLAEIEKTAATLMEAETLLEDGAAGGPATLVKALRLHEPTEILLRLAAESTQLLQRNPGEAQAEVEASIECTARAQPASRGTSRARSRDILSSSS